MTRFLFLSYPAEVVFDEVHFGKFVSAYSTHKYYFDIHPPLGKLLIAGFTKIAGFDLKGQDPDKVFAQIGGQLNAKDFFILRFLPAFFSVLFVILIYRLVLIMGLSKKSAFLAAFLVIFDNAILTHSKFILVDIFLLFFGFSAIYFFLISKKHAHTNKKSLVFLIISAIFTGLAFSIKWTGLSFLGLIIAWIMFDFLRNSEIKIKEIVKKILIFILVSFIIYFLIFLIHFKILEKSGSGDAFMSQSFQKTLTGNTVQGDVKPLSLWGKFIELNQAMYKYNKNIKTQHPDASKWYDWPTTQKPIWYWTKEIDGKPTNIYLLANPLVWWSALLAIFFALFVLAKKKSRKKMPLIIYILIFGYFINLLPFVFISRVTFLYHYFISLTFGILVAALLTEKIFHKPSPPPEKPYKLKKQKVEPKKGFLGFPSLPHIFLYFCYLALIVLVFLALFPLSYGFPVPNQVFDLYKNFLKF